jgi:hypothetical protein
MLNSKQDFGTKSVLGDIAADSRIKETGYEAVVCFLPTEDSAQMRDPDNTIHNEFFFP